MQKCFLCSARCVFVAVVFLSLLIFQSSAVAAQKTVTLTFGHGATDDNNLAQGVVYFAKRCNELSEGTLNIEVHGNGVLCSESTCVPLVKSGGVDFGLAGDNNLLPHTDAFLLTGLPYLYKSFDGYHKIWWGPVGKELMTKASKDMGLSCLFAFDSGAGYKVLLNNKREIRVPNDTKGLKFRIPGSAIDAALFEAWGAAGTPVSWGETYSAIEQNVIDGELLSYAWFYWSKHAEIVPFMTEFATNTMNCEIIMMNNDSWKRLSPEHQKVVMEAGREAEQYNAKLNVEYSEKFLNLLINESGVKYYKPNAEEKKLWEAAAMKVWDQFRDKIPADLLQRALDAQK